MEHGEDTSGAQRRTRRTRFVVAYVVGTVLSTLVLRRMGYGVGGNTIVRCRSGHHYTTWWIPGVSVKALRLGWWRIQHCPIGKHWSLVWPVRAAGLGPVERNRAKAHHDLRLP